MMMAKKKTSKKVAKPRNIAKSVKPERNVEPVKKTIKPKVGKNLPQILGDTLVRDWYAAISEFVCNSYDADAENVYIEISPKGETLSIRDDGSGMNRKGLEQFFKLGDSEKLDEPISPIKGRRRVGKKGIAKTLLRYLGDSFSVNSVCESEKYIIDEGVVEGKIKGNSIPVSSETPTGTTIDLRGLRFQVKEGEFDINKLYHRLQWDIPNKPDFDVFVNGKLVKKRGLVEYASVFKIDGVVGKNQRVTGRLYMHKTRKRNLEGVMVYVNGRAVGGSSLFKLSEIDERLVGRVQGEVNADFLEDLITLDRSQFQDDPRVDLTVKAVNEVLRSMKNDLDKGSMRRAYYQSDRSYALIESSLLEAQEQLNNRLGVEYELELSAGTTSGPVAIFDSDSNKIYLNANNRMFSFVKSKGRGNNKLSEIYLKRVFLIAAAHAITKQEQGDERISELIATQTGEAFKDYSGIGNIVGKFIGGNLLIPLKEIYLNPCKLYDHFDVSFMTGRPANIIRLLHSSEALPGSEEHLFSKENLLESLTPLEGYVSCIEVVDPAYTQVNIKVGGHIKIVYDHPKPTSLDVALATSSMNGLDVVNVGKRHPMHFVSQIDSRMFHDYAKNEGLCS